MHYVGAGVLMPFVRDLGSNIPLISGFIENEKLRVAIVSYVGEEFTKGDMSDAFHGSAVGAVGAYTWDSGGLLQGLFGGNGS